MGQATVHHLNELYTFIENENKVLKEDNKVLKDDNKVLKDKIKALEDKAEKAEAFNNEVLMGKIVEVETAVGDFARSDTPIEETTSIKKTIKELTEEVKRSNRAVAEYAGIGERFDNFLRENPGFARTQRGKNAIGANPLLPRILFKTHRHRRHQYSLLHRPPKQK